MKLRDEGFKAWARSLFWGFVVWVALPVVAVVAILIAVAFSAEAHLSCGPYHESEDTLAKKHGESVAAEFVTKDGNVLLMFADPIDESWTLIELHPDGRGCTLKQGKGFEGIRPPKRGERT